LVDDFGVVLGSAKAIHQIIRKAPSKASLADIASETDRVYSAQISSASVRAALISAPSKVKESLRSIFGNATNVPCIRATHARAGRKENAEKELLTAPKLEKIFPERAFVHE
jgi:hypothetical protein